MTPQEYLEKVLAKQMFAADSDELQALQDHRAKVEDILRKAFPKSALTIRYGGSKAKGTMNRDSYDLDVICYFNNGDTNAGDSLKDIFANVQAALQKDYDVLPKKSALRLRSKAQDTLGLDFHIDVVPGRFTDDKKEDTYLYQASGEKERLKTNLQVY